MEVNYDNYRKKLGDAILAKREELCISRESLAKQIDRNRPVVEGEKRRKSICVKTIERVEKGEYTNHIGLFTIQTICSELKLSVKFSLGGAS